MENINIGSYIEKNLMKVRGYDYNWTSMISSNPILFEDIDYLKVKNYVNNTVTESELSAYKKGQLRKIYMNFETMIMDNIDYYNRIISYCTMIFCSYINVDGVASNKNIPKHVISFDITPTKIWCAAMTSTSSTMYELDYGWGVKTLDLHNNNSPLQNNFHILKKNKLFSVWISYRALISNTHGFRETFMCDLTDNSTLYRVCKKFIQKSPVLGFDDSSYIDHYIKTEDQNTDKLCDSISKCMDVLYNSNKDFYAVYVFNDEIYLHTHNFAMRVFKKDGSISKDYISNSYDCFVAEPYMKPSIKDQIRWCKYTMPTKFTQTVDVLNTILERILNQNFQDVVCVKKMGQENTLSVVTFSGIFNNVYIHEKFMHNNYVVKEYTKCMSKTNTARYIISKGYYIFGFRNDVELLIKDIENNPYKKIDLIKHHINKYCMNIKTFMKDIVTSYRLYNGDIINYLLNGIPDDRICSEIKTTNLKGMMSHDVNKIIKTININIREKTKEETKSYYKIISE